MRCVFFSSSSSTPVVFFSHFFFVVSRSVRVGGTSLKPSFSLSHRRLVSEVGGQKNKGVGMEADMLASTHCHLTKWRAGPLWQARQQGLR